MISVQMEIIPKEKANQSIEGATNMQGRKNFIFADITSNGGYRHEEKSHKRWSLLTMLLCSVTAIFSRVNATLEAAMLVGRSICLSDGLSVTFLKYSFSLHFKGTLGYFRVLKGTLGYFRVH